MEHPDLKAASPALSYPLPGIWRLKSLLPEIGLKLVSPPSFLLTPYLPAAFQPIIPTLVSLLLFMFACLDLCTFPGLYPYASMSLFTLVLFSVGLLLMFSEKHTE